jgi:hypothetical protein
MKKSNKKHSQNGLKRHMKNVGRKRRSVELKNFNNLVAYFKYMQDMQRKQKEYAETLNVTPAPVDNEAHS